MKKTTKKLVKEKCIQDVVINDLKNRKIVGIERYGTALYTWNKRNSLQDFYEEILDAAQYCKQYMLEREEIINVLKESYMHSSNKTNKKVIKNLLNKLVK